MPGMQIPECFGRILTTKARFIVVLGGRGSGKSESLARILLMKCQTEGADILCGREHMNSIADSVHKLLSSVIDVTGAKGFKVTDNKIDCETGGGFRFRGFSRNPESVKSAQNFSYAFIDEAQVLSDESIKNLLPTIRAEGSQLFFAANPRSAEDPFSKRFITPYLSHLYQHGYFEDDLHLIILANYNSNPWFPESLEAQRQWDYENLPRALYSHIWLAEFNDSVESALIRSEYFDACVDAHLKLGFKPLGARIASTDPSDIGEDSKGFAFRHGSIVLDVQEKTTGDINEGGDWAVDLALKHGVDAFSFDADGMGVGLNRQISKAFDGKHTIVSMFKGSESPDFPDAIYQPAESSEVQGQKTNKEVFRNKRAQYYFELRDRVYRTYRAVEFGEYADPDQMISFSSDIPAIQALRSELCRMPIKPNGNGLCELYTKEDMKKKFKFKSPNLADSVMMLMRHVKKANIQPRMPKPIKPMGRR